MSGVLINGSIFLVTLVAMEGVAYLTHRYIMHGFGWGWHESHHRPRTGRFERNDLFALSFAGISIALIWTGVHAFGPLLWVGLGMTAYGVLYFLFHEGLVHRRWPFKWNPGSGYVRRLIQAHKLHHAVRGREGCVSFGFLYAPPLTRLKEQFRMLHGDRSGGTAR